MCSDVAAKKLKDAVNILIKQKFKILINQNSINLKEILNICIHLYQINILINHLTQAESKSTLLPNSTDTNLLLVFLKIKIRFLASQRKTTKTQESILSVIEALFMVVIRKKLLKFLYWTALL
jgi:hypothetical protein